MNGNVAYVFAQLMLMALWMAAGASAVQRTPAVYLEQEGRRITIILGLLVSGWSILMVMSWYQLPQSVLSQGWAREDINNAIYMSGVLNGVLGFAMAARLYQKVSPEKSLLIRKTTKGVSKPTSTKTATAKKRLENHHQ